MKISTLMKAGLVGAGAVFGAAAAPVHAETGKEKAPAEKTSEKAPEQGDSALFEETAAIQGDSATFYHFLKLSSGGDGYFKGMFTDREDSDTLHLGAKGRFNFGFMEGTAELIGFSDSEKNYGIGVNARGDVEKTRIGISLERRALGGDSENMFLAYGRRKFGNLEPMLGIAAIVNGDDIETKGLAALSYTLGQFVFGAAARANQDGDGDFTAVAGRMAEKKGEGFGYRLWTNVDFDGNYTIDLIASTNTTFSYPGITCIISPDSGLQDPKLFKNQFDKLSYLWERTTPGGFAGNIRVSGKNDGTLAGAGRLLYRFPGFSGISPKVGIGGGFTRDNDETRLSVSPSIGVSYKNLDIEVIATAGEGQRPAYLVIGSVGFSF